MTPRRPLPFLAPAAIAVALAVVGDAAAAPARHHAPVHHRAAVHHRAPVRRYAARRAAAATAARHVVAPAVPRPSLATASVRTTKTPAVQPLGVPGTWTLKFDDEFSATSLDRRKWQPNWLGPSNSTVTPPVNGSDLNCTSPTQVSEGAGVLNLNAVATSCRASNGTTYSYAGGLVNTANSFTYTHGYAEARIYVPATASGAAANFPAFWADGTGNWPDTGELDIMEVLGDCGPGEGFHFHSDLGAFGGCPTVPVTTGWHTFGANWQSGVVTFYYDGVQVGQLTQGITGSPMFLILDNSVDPSLGGPTSVPADLQVDYVRVWQ